MIKAHSGRAWDSNPEQQDGRQSRIHRAMAAPHLPLIINYILASNPETAVDKWKNGKNVKVDLKFLNTKPKLFQTNFEASFSSRRYVKINFRLDYPNLISSQTYLGSQKRRLGIGQFLYLRTDGFIFLFYLHWWML